MRNYNGHSPIARSAWPRRQPKLDWMKWNLLAYQLQNLFTITTTTRRRRKIKALPLPASCVQVTLLHFLFTHKFGQKDLKFAFAPFAEWLDTWLNSWIWLQGKHASALEQFVLAACAASAYDFVKKLKMLLFIASKTVESGRKYAWKSKRVVVNVF